MVLIIGIGSAALVWYYMPQRSDRFTARYYHLQQQNHALQNRIAALKGEFALAKEQNDGLRNELLADQQASEALQQRLNIYTSILEARKSSGVRILRATAHMPDKHALSYSLVLVKGGNYPRSVRGSIRITAFGSKGEKRLLQLTKSTAELPYKMVTHAFLEGSTRWQPSWQPVRLQITRLNQQGVQRDQMEIKLNGDTTKHDTAMLSITQPNTLNLGTPEKTSVPGTEETP